MNPAESLPILVIAGSTATGKSHLAIRVACEMVRRGQRAEIVNADSMLVYRGMDIGTAKPSMSERQGITHHLIDIMDVSQTASVADFQRLARGTIDQVRSRGAVPIVVGGSALYLHAIMDRVDFPPTNERVRAHWDAELAKRGSEALHTQLRQIAPDVAEGIHPGNGRRIVRALESIEITGTFQPSLPTWEYAMSGVVQIGLSVERAIMDERIRTRVCRMWAKGLVDEVAALIPRGLRESRTASRAIGYAETLAYLDGTLTQTEAIERTVIRTRQFSRKQFAWWKRDPRTTWMSDPSVEIVLDNALSRAKT